MKIAKPHIGTAFFLTILLASALKDDAEVLANSAHWAEMTVHPIIALFKEYSILFLVASGAIGAIILTMYKSWSFRTSNAAILISILIFFPILRSVYFDAEAAQKLFQAFTLTFFVLVVGWRIAATYGPAALKRDLANAFYWFSIILVAGNAVNAALGHGFAPNNPRLFGTSAHPNFLGVQLAICNIVIATKIVEFSFSRWKQHVIPIFILAVGLIALLLTGSRTGFLVMAAGMSTLWLTKRKFRIDIWLIILVLILGVFFIFLLFNADTGSSFYRGQDGANTRSEAWDSMLALIKQNPWNGTGYFTGYSENSYLRSMVAFGIPYGIFLIIALIYIEIILLRLSWKCRNAPTSPEHLYLSLMTAIMLGGFFEGYLIDSWSVPRLTLILLTLACIYQRSSPSNFSARRNHHHPTPSAPTEYGPS